MCGGRERKARRRHSETCSGYERSSQLRLQVHANRKCFGVSQKVLRPKTLTRNAIRNSSTSLRVIPVYRSFRKIHLKMYICNEPGLFQCSAQPSTLQTPSTDRQLPRLLLHHPHTLENVERTVTILSAAGLSSAAAAAPAASEKAECIPYIVST